MKELTTSARQGLMLAKAVRLTRLMTHECASRLTENVTDIHDTLKTCLFILHHRLSDPTVELLPEQWALMIYHQLLQFLKNGYMPSFFNGLWDERFYALLDCKHDLKEILEHDELRAACCDQRIDMFIIAEHLHHILCRCCQLKHIPSADDIFRRLPPYHPKAKYERVYRKN